MELIFLDISWETPQCIPEPILNGLMVCALKISCAPAPQKEWNAWLLKANTNPANRPSAETPLQWWVRPWNSNELAHRTSLFGKGSALLCDLYSTQSLVSTSTNGLQCRTSPQQPGEHTSSGIWGGLYYSRSMETTKPPFKVGKFQP